MCRLLNFIIIDEFKARRQGSLYFLSHWHSGITIKYNSDHYDGILSKWPYGPIYCSPITKRLLLTKFPKLNDIVTELKYNQENIIKQEIINFFGILESIELKVKIYDSNHMAGSIMILLEYQGKNYLHTGDMRFNENVAHSLPDLFQKSINPMNPQNIEFTCRYKI